MTPSQKRSALPPAVIGSAGFVALAAALVMILRTGGSGLSELDRVVVGTLGFLVLVGWWGFWMARSFRAKDEYLRHVERASWFKGGLIGLMASVPVYAFIGLGGLHWLNPQSPFGQDISRAFALGYMLPMLMQVAGVLIVALWMRLARR